MRIVFIYLKLNYYILYKSVFSTYLLFVKRLNLFKLKMLSAFIHCLVICWSISKISTQEDILQVKRLTGCNSLLVILYILCLQNVCTSLRSSGVLKIVAFGPINQTHILLLANNKLGYLVSQEALIVDCLTQHGGGDCSLDLSKAMEFQLESATNIK